ncbi:MAG: HD domain-containing protein [Bacteroidales bacterium]|nr:MAG: HD domain-containing protein [Bacteroidales bacterium]
MINNLARSVKELCQHDSSGHDWWHIHRVVNLAKNIGSKEGADLPIVETAALLHDLDDWKLTSNNQENLPNARALLIEYGATAELTERVITIINEVSFKGAGVDTKPTSIEAMVVQDADRLDAIGAIGIARTFAYGGYKNQPMHNPNLKPALHNSYEDYKSMRTSTINHFYEKLLLLKDRLNTKTAIELAIQRHRFMEQFLEQFYAEWNID